MRRVAHGARRMPAMRIQSPKSHWTGVGRMAARMRMTLASALTNDARVDAWITAGFKSMKRKIDRREIERLGDADTFALVKGKLGI
jgi:hypothetical protein